MKLVHSGVAAAVALAAFAGAARAEDKPVVGKVSVLEGTGARYADAAQDPGALDGKAHQALAVGSDILLGDVVKLESGRLKLKLNDESVIALGSDDGKSGGQAGALLAINEGDFGSQVRKFGAKLVFGKIWSHVTKALSGSDSKFEVSTPRAVAGVRGTIFRVDAVQFVTATKPKAKKAPSTIVRVDEGKVGVEAKVKKLAMADKPGEKPGRHEVQGPQEISKEEWEKKFVELQKGMAVAIDDDQMGSIKPPAKDDFDRFAERP